MKNWGVKGADLRLGDCRNILAEMPDNCAADTAANDESKTIAREEVVPWSIAKM